MNTVIMSSEQLDDGSHVVNFDEIDDVGTVCVTGGYVHVALENGLVSVRVFNKDGTILNEHEYIEEEFV
jgi:hypothetical protein